MKALLVAIAMVLVTGATPAWAEPEPDPVVTTVAWDRTGAENLPCSGGAHWRFDQGTPIVDTGISNVGIYFEELSTVIGMGFDPMLGYPRLFTADTLYSITTETVIGYNYTGTGNEADHLVLENCLSTDPPETCQAELAEIKAHLSAAKARTAALEEAVRSALAVRGNARAKVRAMRTILHAALAAAQ